MGEDTDDEAPDDLGEIVTDEESEFELTLDGDDSE